MLPLLLIVASGVVYHVTQKAAGPAGSPWPVLALAYAVALVACLALGWAADGGALVRRVPDRRTLALGGALGLAVLGVELGYFLVYRAGGKMNSASVLASVMTTAALAVIGFAVLGERLSSQRLAGIGLAAAAGWLMVRG